MKKANKVLLVCTLCLFLSVPTKSSYSIIENQSNISNLDSTASTPPVIIFDLSNMATSGILTINVYDAENNLSEVSVFHNGLELFSPNITVTWNDTDWSLQTPPLSIKTHDYENSLDDSAPDNDQTAYKGEITVDDVFVSGDHNEITVESSNLSGDIAMSTILFCNTVDCWGRGGGTSNDDIFTVTREPPTGVPVMTFNMTGYYCCGYIEPIIEPTDSSIVNFTVFYNETDNMLAMTVLTEEGNFFKTAITLDETVDLNLFGCRDCSCPIEVPTAEPSFIFLALSSGVVILATILKINKRKRKT